MRKIRLLLLMTLLLTAACSRVSLSITDAQTAMDINDKLLPVHVTSNFSEGIQKIYCWFQWKDAKPKSTMMARWFFVTDQIHILDYNFEIPRKEGFGSISLVMPEGRELPVGNYKIELIAGQKIIKTVTFSITPINS